MFHWIQRIKIFVITVKGLKCANSCVRGQDVTTATVRHMCETGSLNWAKFILHWFIRFAEFAEFNEGFAPFRKNSNSSSLKWIQVYFWATLSFSKKHEVGRESLRCKYWLFVHVRWLDARSLYSRLRGGCLSQVDDFPCTILDSFLFQYTSE